MLRSAWGQRWKNKQFKGKTSKTCTDSSLHTLLWSDSKLALFCYSRQRNDIQSSLFNKGSLWPFTHGRNSFWYVRTSTKCKKENKYLRDKIATSARKLSSKILDWNSFEVYVTCGMIPSNKSSDVVELAKPLLKTATRVQGGAEALIHAMKTVLEHGESKSVILVDEMNMLICSTDARHNVQVFCPKFSPILINTHRELSRMMLLGRNEFFSWKGTIQGDSLVLSFYAIGIRPLLRTH